VASSGTVTDSQDGQEYTQAGMNGVPEWQTAKAFERADFWFTAEPGDRKTRARVQTALQPAADCFEDVGVEEREFFCGMLEDYVRLYAFLSQVIESVDVDLEKLYSLGGCCCAA
jgi:hypothetical protein